MAATRQNKTQTRVTAFIASTGKSTKNMPFSMKRSATLLLMCLLLRFCDVLVLGVVGFATTSRSVRSNSSLGLVSISQDVAVGHTLPSSSSPPSLLPSTTSQLRPLILYKAEVNTLFDSRLVRSLSSSSASTTALLAVSETDDTTTIGKNLGTNKRNFFAALDTLETLNGATKERSELLATMIDEKKVVGVGAKSKELATSSYSSTIPTVSYEKPGSTETFLASSGSGPLVAEGTWKIIYAPHITTAMNLFRGRFDVTYDLFPDSRIVSHAYYDFPVFGRGFLSVSGTYGSVAGDASNTYSRVDFDKAWIKALPSSSSSSTAAATLSDAPYNSLETVPDSFLKTVINEIGKRAFIESVAIFPVSFLDDDTIVFEFEFLGTKICARKV